MASKTKSTNQPKVKVCGNCGIDIDGDYFIIESNDVRLHRCALCAKVVVERETKEKISHLEGVILDANTYSSTIALNHDIKPHHINIPKYVIAHSKKLIDMFKTDLQLLDIRKNEMSRKYLVALSTKIVEEIHLMSEQGSLEERLYLGMCDELQALLKQYDSFFETKLKLYK